MLTYKLLLVDEDDDEQLQAFEDMDAQRLLNLHDGEAGTLYTVETTAPRLQAQLMLLGKVFLDDFCREDLQVVFFSPDEPPEFITL